MRISQVIRRRIRERTDGVDRAGDVTAAIAANVGERGAFTWTSAGEADPPRARRPQDAPATAGGSDERDADA
jgi:hypothetical protein